jgi:hypothetical protein
MITDQVKYAVVKGGPNVTSQPFSAITQTPTSHVYNIAVPSLETIISREVFWETEVTLEITGTNKPAHEFLINYGVTDALAPFPVHNLVASMTCTINNNTVATNMQDVLPIILRLCDPEELANYNDMTPTTLDYLSKYEDGVDRMPFQIRRVENAAGGAPTARPAILDVGPLAALRPRHSFVSQIDAILNTREDLVDQLSTITAPTMVIVGNQDILTPRGDSEEIAERIPNAELVVISGAAHGLMMEHSSTFNRILIEFLQRTELARVSEQQLTA